MIVVDRPHQTEPAWRLVTQPDHARFSAQLGRLWRLQGLPEHPRRDDLLFAVREHDNGWRELDAAPQWNATAQRPHDFLSLPRPERHRMWLRGVDRYRAERPWAALLIAEHARRLPPSSDSSELAEFLQGLDQRREALLEEVADAEELAGKLTERTVTLGDRAANDYAWLDLLDLASLAVCQERTEPFERHLPAGGTVRGRFDLHPDSAPPAGSDDEDHLAGTLHLEPFPLAGATRFQIPCRFLPMRDYGGDVHLAVALARARWVRFVVRVAPGP